MAEMPASFDAPVRRRPYGCLADEREVGAWTLRSPGGMRLEVLEYGGAVSRLEIPDGKGGSVDVVLGFDTLGPWEHDNASYFGIIAGRVAGRIPGGRLRFDGQTHELACNEEFNHLHGGHVGLDKRIWSARAVDALDGALALELRYTSPDGEQGYPGTLELSATYTLTPDHRLIFDTTARSDRTTPVSLAQHSYFNLAGTGSVEDHELQILAGTRMTTDENMTQLGVAESVDGQAADLRRPRPLREVIPGLWQHHGDLYRLEDGATLKHAAHLHHPASGRRLDTWTSHDFVQLYTAAHLDGSLIGKRGVRYPKHGGLCLECQGYPDPAAGFGDILVRPGETQRHRTIYAFDPGG